MLACVGVIGREDGEGAGGGDKLDAPEPIAASPCGPFLRTGGRGRLRAVHSRSAASPTRAYTPGLPARAQPSPNDVAPTTRSAPVDV